MLKIFTDFNASTNGDVCWLLKYRESDLAQQIDELKLGRGDRIILFQDDDDFEVVATLDIRYVDVLGQEAWVAIPDWRTLVRK
jgi:hypothetical protein